MTLILLEPIKRIKKITKKAEKYFFNREMVNILWYRNFAHVCIKNSIRYRETELIVPWYTTSQSIAKMSFLWEKFLISVLEMMLTEAEDTD
jgi:hypothetical protein